MRRRSTFLLTLLVSIFSLSACTSKISPAHTFSFRLRGEPETIDWNRARSLVEFALISNLMEGLTAYDNQMKIAPALAESWVISKDGKRVTFTLRKGVRWSDGVPLTARDFVFSWKRLLTPTTAAPYAFVLFEVEGAESFYRGKTDFSKVGIKALSEQTFEVSFVRPIGSALAFTTLAATFPLREDVVTKHGVRWTRPENIVTLGAFTLFRMGLDGRIVLRANPNYYYVRRGNIQEAVAYVTADDSTAINLYESGPLDFLPELSMMDIGRYEGRTDLRRFPLFKTDYLGFIVTKPPLDRAGVRRAIGMAIDRRGAVELLHGGQTPATSFVPPGLEGYSQQGGLPFDPALAREELKKAGLVPSSVNIDLVIRNSDKEILIAQYLQNQLQKNLGITLSIHPFDGKAFRSQIDSGSFGLFENSWSADFVDPNNFLSLFIADSGSNRTRWKDPKYDQLVSARLYPKAQQLLLKDAAVILPLYYESNTALIKPRVRGLSITPLGGVFLRDVILDTGHSG